MRDISVVNKPKIVSLQAIRALAFMGIFSMHCGVGELGAWGVSVFLVLSGFVMSYTYLDQEMDVSIKNNFYFSLKKIKRLYPLHIFMMITALPFLVKAVIENFTVYSVTENFGKIVLNVLLFQTWIAHSKIYFSLNGVAWYLSVCLFIYMIFPYIMRNIKRYSNYKKAYSGIIVIFACQVLVAYLTRFIGLPEKYSNNFSKWITYILPLYRLGDFTIGCNLGYLFLKHRINLSVILTTICEVVVFALIGMSQVIYIRQVTFLGSEWWRYTLLYLPTSCILVYLVAFGKGYISRILTNKVTIFIGNISPYTFLIHQMVIRYLRLVIIYVVNIEMNAYLFMFLAFVITIVCTLIYMQIEERGKCVISKIVKKELDYE